MSTSRGPQIIDTLRDAVPDVLNPVQFSEAWPGVGIQATTFVAMDFESTIEPSSAVTALGPANYIEDGKLTNYLMVSLPGKTAAEVREHAFVIADQFTAWVRSSITLGGIVCGWAWVSAVQWTPGIGDNARDGALRIDLSWHDENL